MTFVFCKYGFHSSGKGAILPLNKQTIEASFFLMAQWLDWMSMRVLECASSPGLNPFATFVKDLLLRSQFGWQWCTRDALY